MRDKIYKAKVDGNWFFLIAVFISFVMILIGETSNTNGNKEYYVGILAVGIIGSLLYWMALKCTYTLTSDRLIIKFFLYTNELPYKYIQHIKFSNYPSSGRKAAFAKEGLSIFYSQGNLLFIAPENRDVFVEDLAQRREKIQVIK